MGEYVANTNRVISITPNGGWTPGSPTYTQTTASKLKVGGAAVVLSPIPWTVTGCSMGAFSGGGGGSMSAAGSWPKSNSTKAMRANDKGQCNGSLVGPNGATMACNCEYKITDAGQSNTKGG